MTPLLFHHFFSSSHLSSQENFTSGLISDSFNPKTLELLTCKLVFHKTHSPDNNAPARLKDLTRSLHISFKCIVTNLHNMKFQLKIYCSGGKNNNNNNNFQKVAFPLLLFVLLFEHSLFLSRLVVPSKGHIRSHDSGFWQTQPNIQQEQKNSELQHTTTPILKRKQRIRTKNHSH